MSDPGQPLPGLAGWFHGIATAFSTVLTEQPLMQVLLASFFIGTLTGLMRALHPIADALIRCSEWTLNGFSRLLWYYPIMIGCLAIFIPARFGLHGLQVYGRTSLNLAIVARGVVRGDVAAGTRDHQTDLAADLEVFRHGVRHRIRHRRLV